MTTRHTHALSVTKYLFRVLGYAGGALLCALIILSRLPNLYNSIWEDPVHYNYAYLSARTFIQLQHNITFLFQPLLDLAIRKWVWFSYFGFPMTEKHVGLVSLIYSGVHLIAFLFIPWTRFLGLRILGCVLLGFCPVETAYAAQAQGYSFASLAPTVCSFAFLWSTHLLSKHATRPAVGVFLAGWALMLNAHFFAWPMAMIVWVFYGSYLWREMRPQDKRSACIRDFLLWAAYILVLTVAINLYSLNSLMRSPPAANAGTIHMDWKLMSRGVAQTWSWIGVKSWWYLVALVAGWFHPERPKRYLGVALSLSLIVIKFLMIGVMTWRSSYPIADRYLIMFIGPSIFAGLMGIESLALHLNKLWRSAGVPLTWACLLLVGWPWKDDFLHLPEHSSENFSIWKALPANHSRNFHFFEHIKSEGKPTLILTNHCWASDIPNLYMRYLGSPPLFPLTILNTCRSCETPDAVRKTAINAFLTQFSETGQVAIFYEQMGQKPNPCNANLEFDYQLPQGGGCVAILSARSIKNFLLRNEAG